VARAEVRGALIVQVDAPLGLRDCYGQFRYTHSFDRSCGPPRVFPARAIWGLRTCAFFAWRQTEREDKLRRFAFGLGFQFRTSFRARPGCRTIEVIVKPTTKPKYLRAFNL
jgi:hypothetical protein